MRVLKILIALRNGRRPVDLRTDEQDPVEGPKAHRCGELHLAAERHATEALGQVTVLEANLRGVREDAHVTGRSEVRLHARAAVARVVASRSERGEHLDADAQPERIAVGPDESDVGPDPQIADAELGGRRVRHAAERPGVSVFVDGDGQIEGEAKSVQEHERRTHVSEDLVADEPRPERPVGVVDGQRQIAVVADDADRLPKIAPHVERIEGEPVAAPLGWVEAIERKSGRLRAGGSRSEQAKSQPR